MVLAGRKTFLITGFIIIILGIGLIAGGIYFNKSSQSKLAHWVKTYAYVVGYDEYYERDSDGYERILYSAVVVYEVDGVEYELTENSHSSIPPSYGTSREVAYNPDNPSDAIITSDSILMPTILLCGSGGVFVFLGILTFVTYAKKKR